MKKNNHLVETILGIVVIIVIASIFVLLLLFPSSRSFEEKEKKEKNYFNEISYTVPSEFEKDDYYHSKYYTYYDTSLNCSIDISAEEKDREESLEKWFKGEVTFTLNDELGELKELEINGNKILGINVKRGGKYSWSTEESYYGVESSNYYYKIEYRIVDYKNGDREKMEPSLCLSTLDNLLSSIKTH